eukprot:15185677-Ditylum_brightwellii.AAC.1
MASGMASKFSKLKGKEKKLKETAEGYLELKEIIQKLNWPKHFEIIKQIVLQAKPDIITFQEMDHTYKPPTYTGQKGGSHHDDISPNNYFLHILKSHTAFAPKSYSNAYLFRSKQSGKASDIDNDGFCVSAPPICPYKQY